MKYRLIDKRGDFVISLYTQMLFSPREFVGSVTGKTAYSLPPSPVLMLILDSCDGKREDPLPEEDGSR